MVNHVALVKSFILVELWLLCVGWLDIEAGVKYNNDILDQCKAQEF